MNVQIAGEYFFVLYFYLRNFFVFSIDLPVYWSLCGLQTRDWVTVSASLPFGRFCPYLGWGVTSSHLSVSLPLCSIIPKINICNNVGSHAKNQPLLSTN